jgi:hypothetical protein
VLLMMVVAAGVVLNGPVGSVLYWALGLVAWTALWWWTARLMVRGEVRWRALLPTAIVTGSDVPVRGRSHGRLSESLAPTAQAGFDSFVGEKSLYGR